MEADAILNLAKSLGDQSRSSSNYGKLSLIRDIIMELDTFDLSIESKAKIKIYLENTKTKIKEDIRKDEKFPDPYLDKM